MALVKYGGGITGVSGSIAGNTFGRNRSGSYVRCRTKPVNPNSTNQVKVRTAVSFLTARWFNTLSAENRSGWGQYADGVNMKNKLGDVIHLTGFNHFVRSNATIARVGGYAFHDTPPVINELAEKDPTVSITATVASQQVTLTFDNTLGWANEVGGQMYVSLGQPQNKTRNFFGGPYKFMGIIDGAVVPPNSPFTFSLSPYALGLGERIWVAIRIIRADGRLSEKFFCNCFVTAGGA